MTTARRLRAIGLTLLLVVHAALAAASELSDDVKARRARVMERLGPDSLLVLWSAPSQRYSLDIDYEYRQDSNLYYLTGLTQAETILILMPGNESKREILFIRDRNPAREQVTGRLLSVDDAKAATGIETVLSTSLFEPFLAAMLDRRPFAGIDDQQAAKFFAAVTAGHARLQLLLPPNRGLNDPLTRPLELARQLRERYFGFTTADATPILTELRTIKTPYERKVLTKDLEISGEAQMAGMRAARPGAYEYEVKAAIEGSYRGRGAVSWSYPSIVGSGPNATILHYADSERQMQAGELLLVDAAANYQYMSGDITRTYPVSGTFSPLHKDIYRLVLRAQEEAIAVAKTNGSLQAIHDKTVEVIKAGLLDLGLITDTKGNQYRMWYTHGATHYIGIDVHDVGDRRRPLVPGMAFTIEPGIYIRQEALDALPATPENQALIEKIRPAVKKYQNIGVRIEDSFLMDDSGLRRLSASAPRTIEEIETYMKPRSSK